MCEHIIKTIHAFDNSCLPQRLPRSLRLNTLVLL